jgi:hypothetical protein
MAAGLEDRRPVNGLGKAVVPYRTGKRDEEARLQFELQLTCERPGHRPGARAIGRLAIVRPPVADALA